MLKNIVLLKNSKSEVLVSIALSLLFVFLWIIADTFPIGKTEKAVFEYTTWDSLYIKGYDVEDNDFTRTGNDAYIVLQSGDTVDRIAISADCLEQDGISMTVYYEDSEGKFTTSNSMTKELIGSDTVSIRLPNVSTKIKLKFEGNLNKTININRISLYKSDICLNKRLLLSVGIAFIVLLLFSYVALNWAGGHCCRTGDYFFLTLLVGGVLFVATAFVTNNYYWGSYFSSNEKDAFMDHFNMLMLARGDEPYATDASYPAMSFLILKLFWMLLPSKVSVIDNVTELKSNAIVISVFSFLIIGCVISIYFLMKKILGNIFGDNKLMLLLFTGPILYVIQRGNILLVAFIFILVYVWLYDSKDKRLRYVAYIALALAASIKIYPAVFGLMTVKKKRYKEAVTLAGIGFVLFALPFFYYDGIETFKEFLVGLSQASEVMTAQGLGQNISLDNIRQFVNTVLGIGIPSSQIVLLIVNVGIVALALMTKKEWQAWFLLAVVCAWYPAFSFTYVLLLFYPAILIGVRDEDGLSAFDYVLFGILIIPTGLPYLQWIDNYVDTTNLQMKMSVSSIIINLLIVFWVLRLIVDIVYRCKSNVDMKPSVRLVVNSVIGYPLVAGLFIILGIGCMRPYNADYSFAGEGTKNHPYEISSVEDFMYLVETVNSGEDFSGVYFIQTSDIQFDGVTSIDPIGWDSVEACFSGVYNGQGYSLIDYYSLSPNDQNMGLFGVLDGEVYNLNMINCNIGGNLVGTFAYEVTENGVIENCYANGQILGYQVGGIAAINYGTIENCVSYVNITGTEINNVAENSEDGTLNNNYGTNSKWDGLIDSNTYAKLNSHVDRKNDSISCIIGLNRWEVDTTSFARVSTGQ